MSEGEPRSDEIDPNSPTGRLALHVLLQTLGLLGAFAAVVDNVALGNAIPPDLEKLLMRLPIATAAGSTGIEAISLAYISFFQPIWQSRADAILNALKPANDKPL